MFDFKKIKYLLLILPIIYSSGCSVLGISNVSEVKYTTIKKEDSYSVRNYSPVMLAEVTVSDNDYNQSSSKAFRILFNYISGENSLDEKISMTAPILKQKEISVKIPMTAPVLVDQEKDGNWSMSFVLPDSYNLTNTPVPKNENIKVYMRKSEKVAVIRFNGRMTEKNRVKYTQMLNSWIKNHNYTQISGPIYAVYNPPWTLPIFRKNEVQIVID